MQLIRQFERTLIIADEGSYVSYLEGCTAPMRDDNQLHAAVVELIALDNAEIKYSTVQNCTQEMKMVKVVYIILLQKEELVEVNSRISWTQVETGFSITWKYPSVLLQGDNVAVLFGYISNRKQQDTGTNDSY